MLLLSKPLKVSLTISAVLLALIVVIDLLRHVPPRERLRAMRDGLVELRASADSCRLALEQEEALLQSSDARFDSLRSLIQRYEGLDPRGVPADSYDLYLEAFNSYNEGIPAREAAGETLQANWDRCTAIIEQHNQLADSARRIAEESDLVNDSIRRVPIR